MDSDTTRQTTILIVDDDQSILSNMIDLLRVSGYRVVAAANGEKGLQVMQHHTPDLIVADIMMPEMDGYEFYQAVRENPDWITIPFIFLTAKGEPKDIQQGYRLGADHYLTKPFEPEDLLTAIEARLRRTAEIQAATREDMEHTRTWLLSVLSHELRIPLNRMYGHVSMLEEGHRAMTNDVIDRVLHGARSETDRLLHLVEDLMLLARIDSGLAELEVERHRENTILGYQIRNAIRDLSPKAEVKGIAFTYPLETDLVVRGVPAFIEDILKRLIDNAIKFGKVGGHIWIRLEERGEFVTISVQDNGIGIEPEQQRSLFNRFERAVQQAVEQQNMGLGLTRQATEQQKVGLGLTIAKRMTELQGGTIEVESQPGKGSIFTITLPLNEVEA
jgi:two-component system sensor histidine kinase/response regulator